MILDCLQCGRPMYSGIVARGKCRECDPASYALPTAPFTDIGGKAMRQLVERIEATNRNGDWVRGADTATEVRLRQLEAEPRIIEMQVAFERAVIQPLLRKMHFKLRIPARGVRIPSRRIARVWLKKAERAIKIELESTRRSQLSMGQPR